MCVQICLGGGWRCDNNINATEQSHCFPLHLMIISTTRHKAARSSPTDNRPRGKQKCSIPRGPGLSVFKSVVILFSFIAFSFAFSSKGTALRIRRAWDGQDINIINQNIKLSSGDLLEPQQVSVELLLQPPFLIDHVGGEWLKIVGDGVLAPVIFPQL